MDPYVKLKLNEEILKTKVHKDAGKTPKWDDTLTLKSTNPTDTLEVMVMDEGVASDDDIGRC